MTSKPFSLADLNKLKLSLPQGMTDAGITAQLAHGPVYNAQINPTPRNLSIQTKHGVIVICCETGRVSLPEGMPAEVMASEFWKHIGPSHESMVHNRIEQRANEIFQTQWEHALRTRFPKLLQEEVDKAHRRGIELGIVMGTGKHDWQGKR